MDQALFRQPAAGRASVHGRGARRNAAAWQHAHNPEYSILMIHALFPVALSLHALNLSPAPSDIVFGAPPVDEDNPILSKKSAGGHNASQSKVIMPILHDIHTRNIRESRQIGFL